MPMYNLIDYSANYSETSGILWQFCKDEPNVNDNGAIFNFLSNDTTSSFKIKEKLTVQTDKDETKSVEIMLPLKYLGYFWELLKCL